MDGKDQCYTNDILDLLFLGTGFAFSIFIIRYILCTYILKYILFWTTPNGRNGKLKSNEKRLTHIIDTFWCSIFYVVSASLGIVTLFNKEWLWNHFAFWKDFPQPQDVWYYLLGLGFYAQALITLIFFEVRLKDFPVMLTHHISTLILIIVSYYVGYQRIGSVILLLHDLVDVCLYISKLANSVGLETISLFTGFFLVASYGLCRLIWFPIVILFSVFPRYRITAYYYLVSFSWTGENFTQFRFDACGMCAFGICVSPYWMCVGFMSLLVCLHLYWYSLLIKVAFRNVRSCGKSGDIREDEDLV